MALAQETLEIDPTYVTTETDGSMTLMLQHPIRYKAHPRDVNETEISEIKFRRITVKLLKIMARDDGRKASIDDILKVMAGSTGMRTDQLELLDPVDWKQANAVLVHFLGRSE